MNRSLLYGFLTGLALAVTAGLVLYRGRPAPPPERAAAAEQAAGRYQLVSSIEILMLDTATGELWFHRQGRWHRAAGPPRDDGDRSAVLGEVPGAERTEPPPDPAAAPALPAAAPEERGRAEVIQVESAPERPERPERAAKRPARRP